ncbi:MAG: polysaccharide biosynthesis tyrosine autokinase [Formivibrio sp.]|nr:polysaccharide biosynthesis tyrosine autokinase [Formivibrio sp.]
MSNDFDGDAELGGASNPAWAQAEEDERFLPPVLLAYWHTMLRWRRVLLGVIIGSVAIGLIVTILMSPLYSAKAEIEISRQQKKVTNYDALDAAEGPQDLEFYATQYALLKSNSLLERVGKTLRLADRPEFFAAHGTKMAADAEARRRQVIGLLSKNVTIEPVRSSRLVDVIYTSRSPKLSAEIANVWVREFIGATTDREYDATAQARIFLEHRLSDLRAKVEESQQSAINFASNNNIINLETREGQDGKTLTVRTLSTAELEQLNQALLNARADRISAEVRAKVGKSGVSPEELGNMSLGQMREKRAEVSGEYARLLTQFEPEYPTARALKKQLDELDLAIAKGTTQFGAEREQSYQQALKRETDLQAQVDAAKAQLDRQNHASIQYSIFERDADTNRQLYDGLLQRYKEIAEAGNVGASNIAIVDAAEVPIVPSAPILLVNLAIAFFAGVGISAIAVLALEQIDEGIRSPADVWNLLKLPLLGNVPKSTGDPLEELLDAKSMLSESYFSIQTNLAFSTDHGLPRTFAVTSTREAEGKTTTSIALSEIIARTGKKVLLIDADLRSPSVHHRMKIGNATGFSNLLAGDDNLLANVVDTGRRGLFVLTTGPMPPNPAELLSSDRLRFVIQGLLEHFDLVVLDAPPVLGLADSPLICRAVEGVVYVAEPGKCAMRAIRTSLERLKFVGSRIFGVVVTKIDTNNQHYGFSYGYGYGFGYGYSYGYGSPENEPTVGAAR